VVVVSDGHATDDGAIETAARLFAAGVRVDAIAVPGAGALDAAVTNISAPPSWRRGRALPVTVVARATRPISAMLTLTADGALVSRVPITLGPAAARVTVSTPISSSREVELVAEVKAEGDAQPGNDRRYAATHVGSPLRVLVIGDGLGPVGLADALLAAGAPATVMAPERLPDLPDALSEWNAVVLADVPADRLEPARLSALLDYVKRGGGLLLTGGRQSFGSGGWEATPLAEALPVGLEAPARRARDPVSLVLIVDVSASMGGGGPTAAVTKLDLAREAALLAAEELRSDDRLAVIAYSDEPRVVVSLAPIGGEPSRTGLEEALMGLSAGGGTRILPALRDGIAVLDADRAKVRHAVLLTDGQDSAPDLAAFEAAAREARDAGITLSAIAVGEDADRELLARLALLGHGRSHVALEPSDLPRLTLAESRIVGGHSEQVGVFRAEAGDEHPVRAGLRVEALPPLSGYLALVEKPEADTPLRAPGGDPLLAVWRLGLGQVAAWTSDLGEAWASAWLTEPAARAFWAEALDVLAGPPADARLAVHVTTAGGLATIDARAPDATAPGATLVITRSQTVERVPMLPVAPGRYRATLPVEPGAYPFRVEIAEADGAASVASTFAWDGPAEAWSAFARGPDTLAALARAGGGAVLEPGALEPLAGNAGVAVWPWLLAAAGVLWPIDVARQLGALPRWRRRRPSDPDARLQPVASGRAP
jgi:uncharacterized membrane protein